MIPEIVFFRTNRICPNRHLEYISEKDNKIKVIRKFRVANSRFGKGCFSNTTIEKDETICFLEGKEISWDEFEKRYREGSVRLDDPLQLSETKYLELHKPYIYFNHSCNPNSGFRGKNELVAIRNINPGEEISYDYSSVSWDDDWTRIYGRWTMKCNCGEKNCRKLIGDFPTISESQMRRYILLGIIPEFILEKLAREKGEKFLLSLKT